MAIPAEFGTHTTANEVAKHYAPRIEGKTVLITGVSPGGLGAEAAAAIAVQKPKLLILAGRSPDKCVAFPVSIGPYNVEPTIKIYPDSARRKRTSPNSLRAWRRSRSSSTLRRSSK